MDTDSGHFQVLKGGAASALVSFPISMTYGVIAFAPLGPDYTAYGILAGLFGAIFCSLLLVPAGGRSMLGFGPRAASIVIFSALCSQLLALPTLAFPPQEKIQIVIAIGFVAMALAGLVQALVGVLRFGSIVNFVPYSVIAGFINASVVLIILGQVWPLLGLTRQPSIFDLVDHIDSITPLAIIPGLGAMGLMMLSARYLKAVPAPLVGLVGGVAIYHGLAGLVPDMELGPTLTALDSWQPSFYIFDNADVVFSADVMAEIFWIVVPAALSMAALSSFDTVFSLSALNEMTDEKSDQNKELRAHGIASFGAALFGGLISSGGLNRTKPALDAGARTPLYHVVAAVVMLAALIGASEWINIIPNSVIGGMVLYIGISLFDGWTFSHVFRLKRGELANRKDLLFDFAIILLVITITLLQNLIVAVGVGAAVAVLVFVTKISRNLIKSSSRGPAHRSRKIWPERQQDILNEHGHAIAVLRLQGALFFGTAKTFEEQVDALIADGVKFMVLDFKHTKEIDVSGARALIRVNKSLYKAGGFLALSYVKKERRQQRQEETSNDRRKISGDRGLWRALDSSGAIAQIGNEKLFFDTDIALIACERRLIELVQPEQNTRLETGWTRNKLLDGLAVADLQLLKPLLQRKRYQAGDLVFNQGDQSDGAYFIVRGDIDIMLEFQNTGDSKRLQTFSGGTFFGEMSLLNNAPRSATAIARAPTVCFLLDRQNFEKLYVDFPHISLKMVDSLCAILADRLQHANNLISDLES